MPPHCLPAHTCATRQRRDWSCFLVPVEAHQDAPVFVDVDLALADDLGRLRALHHRLWRDARRRVGLVALDEFVLALIGGSRSVCGAAAIGLVGVAVDAAQRQILAVEAAFALVLEGDQRSREAGDALAFGVEMPVVGPFHVAPRLRDLLPVGALDVAAGIVEHLEHARDRKAGLMFFGQREVLVRIS